MIKTKNYCGKVLIVGRSNAGKSTLFNRLINKKLSIVSKKINTTQKNILGIKTNLNYQIIFIDSPGTFSHYTHKLLRLNILKKKIQIIIFVVEKNTWGIHEEKIWNYIKNEKVPIIIVINKIDLYKKKENILPFIKFLYKKTKSTFIFPVSAKKNIGKSALLQTIKNFIPMNNHLFQNNAITNKNNFSICSEFIRESSLYYLNKEIPYNTKVHIQSIQKNFLKNYIIKATIYCYKNSHLKIIIGKKGNKIKDISILSRKKLKKFFGKEIHLFIKAKKINCN